MIKSLVQLCGCVVLGPSIGPSTRTTIPVIDVSRRETALARAHTHTDTHITFCRLTLISRQRSPKSPEPGSGMKDRPRRRGSPPARSNVRTCERQRERKGRRRRKGRRELGGVHYGRACEIESNGSAFFTRRFRQQHRRLPGLAATARSIVCPAEGCPTCIAWCIPHFASLAPS